MSKNEAQTALVPRLRFPEFRNTPAWDTRTGDQLFDSIANRASVDRLPVLAITQEHGAVPRDAIDYHVSVSVKSVENYKEVRPGDFIISLRSFQGGIEYSAYHGICSPAYVILRQKFEGANSFFRHYFKSDRFIRQLTRNLEGLRDGKMISYRQFSEQLLLFPVSRERQKIADCLGSLDDLIAAEGRKLASLRRHKQGLMQQLFPREGETLPRLRFPEFREAGEWQQDAIGNVATISKGKGIAKSDVTADGETKCIRYGELYTIYGEVIEQVRSRTNLPVSDLALSQAGDVIIPASGESKDDIATCACVVSAGVALGSDLNIIRSPIDGRFLSYNLNGSRRRQLAKVAQGDTVAHLYPTQLSKLAVYFPIEEKEQQRIADCLSSLDVLIVAQTAKLDALRIHKRGLLQQLFPVPPLEGVAT